MLRAIERFKNRLSWLCKKPQLRYLFLSLRKEEAQEVTELEVPQNIEESENLDAQVVCVALANVS